MLEGQRLILLVPLQKSAHIMIGVFLIRVHKTSYTCIYFELTITTFTCRAK